MSPTRLAPPVDAVCAELTREDSWYCRRFRQVRSFPRKYPNWRIYDNSLFKLVSSPRHSLYNQDPWRLVLPKQRHLQALRECHDDVTEGHFGYFKTCRRLLDKYFWPTLRRDDLRYVRACHVCGAKKVPNTPRLGPMGQAERCSYLWQIIQVDIIGHSPPVYKT